jgi:MFS transporter, Spinster family, sphingosine-1-phosphate transporter
VISKPSPRPALALALLLAINLFNYIDRQVLAAVERPIREAFFAPDDPNAKAMTGWLATAFLLTYMTAAPIFGRLADKWSRWALVGFSVALWSLASGGSGLAASFGVLLVTRMLVGIGEAGYGPAAPTIIADLYPVEKRARMLSFFYLAIPVGSALGYVLGGLVNAHYGWRAAFYAVVPPGLVLAALCLFMRDPRGKVIAAPLPGPQPGFRERMRSALADYRALFRIRSYVLNTAGMTAMTFAIGGIAFWMPTYIVEDRSGDFPPNPHLHGEVTTFFGAITVVAGLLATLAGGWAGDRVRKRFPSSYFLVSGVAILFAFPATIAMLYVPFPGAWVLVFIAVFFLFFNTGPTNAALANVSPSRVRASAFALNIFIIHALGDAISPPLIGWIAGRWNMNVAFLLVSVMMLVASVCWLWGTRYLARDTAAVETDPPKTS